MDNSLVVMDKETAIETAAPQPCIRSIVSAKGKVTGARYTFGGNMTPSELKEHLKSRGMTKGINKAVREVQRGKRSIAWAEMQVLLEAVRGKGQVPAYGDVRDHGTTLRFVKVDEAVAKVSKAKADVDPEQVIAEKIGCTIEELRALYNARKA